MATIAANRNHADRVNAAYFFRVTAGSFLSPSPPHRLEEIGVRDNSFSTQPGIRRKTRGILRIHYNLALRINRESAHNPGYRAGKAQPARGVQKQQHAFADAVTLAAGPKAAPFADGQILTRRRTANGMFYLEGDGGGGGCLPEG